MIEERLEIRVPRQKTRERLDTFLTQSLTHASRSQVQKLIRDGHVLVGGKIVKPNHSVRPFELIEVTLVKPPPQDVLPEIIPLDIVYEDTSLLVINKPAGMVVHPAFGNRSGTLVNALLGYCSRLSFMNGPVRPGIVHRIDKDTSGLLVAAKTDAVHRDLAAQFSAKTVQREYVALIWGRLKKGGGTVETQIGRHVRDRKKMSVSGTGKRAVTHYQVMERYPFLTLCRLHLETGRTHQIRVHLAHLGHPVFGDQTYAGRSRPLGGLNRPDTALAVRWLGMMPRQALHARTLGFVHPVTKEFLIFESGLPADIEALLADIRRQYGRQEGISKTTDSPAGSGSDPLFPGIGQGTTMGTGCPEKHNKSDNSSQTIG
ncbi:MAG TPA: RluA family pseudouridine synthase [bacterium]|nr:RluA family pseudouridine synthase [bacterium]